MSLDLFLSKKDKQYSQIIIQIYTHTVIGQFARNFVLNCSTYYFFSDGKGAPPVGL